MVGNNFTFVRFWDDISAGFPSPAEGYEDELLSFDAYLKMDNPATFLHRVEGDVLRHEHIRHGSILVCDGSLTAKVGRLVVGEHEGRTVVRRRSPGVPRLVRGVVVACVVRFRK